MISSSSTTTTTLRKKSGFDRNWIWRLCIKTAIYYAPWLTLKRVLNWAVSSKYDSANWNTSTQTVEYKEPEQRSGIKILLLHYSESVTWFLFKQRWMYKVFNLFDLRLCQIYYPCTHCQIIVPINYPCMNTLLCLMLGIDWWWFKRILCMKRKIWKTFEFSVSLTKSMI